MDVSVAQRLAKAGFYYRFDNTKCFSCGLLKPSFFWREGHDPETVHRRESPDCEFIKGQSDNVPIDGGMRYEQNRLDSFPSWWLDVSVAQRLAKAGFYYWGKGNTECFSCGLRRYFSFWLDGHDPETVHRQLSPDCKFITGQSDNVPIDNKLQENSKTSTDASDPRVSGSRRFPISKSSKSKQNQEVRQPNNNQTKLGSESQHLEPNTGTKPKRIGENENSDIRPSAERSTEARKSELKERKAQYVEQNATSGSSDARRWKPTTGPIARKDTSGIRCVSRETVQTATRRSVTAPEHIARENLTRATDKPADKVSS